MVRDVRTLARQHLRSKTYLPFCLSDHLQSSTDNDAGYHNFFRDSKLIRKSVLEDAIPLIGYSSPILPCRICPFVGSDR